MGIISGMKKRKRKKQSIDRKVFERIIGKGRGAVFTPADFLDLGSRSAVDTALNRGAREGRIRKLGRGLYDRPRLGTDGTLLLPTTDAVVRAIAGRDATRFQPSGAHAANMLGLSEQVPVRIVFLTDGHARTVSLGPRKIVLRHATPRQMATAGRKSGTIIQALRWLGRSNVDETVVAKLRHQLDSRERKDVLLATRSAPVWITKVLHEIAREEGA
jgi:hypothetical protein